MTQHFYAQADDPGWDAAVALSEHLVAGHPLPAFPLPGLGIGEVAHVWGDAQIEQFFATDVAYEQRSFLAFGGLVMLGITAAATMIGNQRRRQDALAEAAPQWRWVGPAGVTVTNRRLVAGDPATGVSIWFAELHQVAVDLTYRQLHLHTTDGVPTRVTGPWVPLLAVAVTHAIYGSVLDVPGRPLAPAQPSPPPAPPPARQPRYTAVVG